MQHFVHILADNPLCNPQTRLPLSRSLWFPQFLDFSWSSPKTMMHKYFADVKAAMTWDFYVFESKLCWDWSVSPLVEIKTKFLLTSKWPKHARFVTWFRLQLTSKCGNRGEKEMRYLAPPDGNWTDCHVKRKPSTIMSSWVSHAFE